MVVVATNWVASFGAWLDCLGLASIGASRAAEPRFAVGTIAKARALAWHEGRMDSTHKVAQPLPSLTLMPITTNPYYDQPQQPHFPSSCFLASSTIT